MTNSHDPKTSEKRARVDDAAMLLDVKKGSLFVPFMLLILASLVFSIQLLPSKSSQDTLKELLHNGCTNLLQSVTAAQKAGDDIAAIQKRLNIGAGNSFAKQCFTLASRSSDPQSATGDENSAVAQEANCKTVGCLVHEYTQKEIVLSSDLLGFITSGAGGFFAFFTLLGAYLKEFVDHMLTALALYWHAVVFTILGAALFALVPGLAGLIYRRAFWVWYGLGFVALLAISTIAGRLDAWVGSSSQSRSLGGGETNSGGPTQADIDFAAEISLTVLSLLFLLLLAYRVRRHTTRPSVLASFLAPQTFNRIIYWALALVAVVIFLDPFLNLLGTKELWASLWAFLPFNDSFEWWSLLLFGIPFLYALLKISETWSGTEPKNIVICLDGTSNTPDQLDMGFLAQTNVFKLFKMLKADKPGSFNPAGRFNSTLCKIYKDRQIGFYYTGIGNKYDHDPVVGTLAQATGLGAGGIIERAYLDLIRVWRPGDRVFITGFSRGAASARILCRVIEERGAPRSIWTLRLFGRHWTIWPSKNKQSVSIDVLGCWDTVGSFGVAKSIAGINFQQMNLLHDMSVPDNVKQAYHMVALDEERVEFAPTLMEPDPIKPERIVEVWFSGTHAGVGGGFATDRLSDVPLEFLLKHISSGYCADGKTEPGLEDWGIYLSAVNGMNAEAAKLASDDTVTICPDPRGQLRVWISSLYNYEPRKLPFHAVISETVFERMTTSEPVYAPQSLFDLNDNLDKKRDQIREKVKILEETQSLTDEERLGILSYTDKLRLTRWPQYFKSIEDSHDLKPVTETLANLPQ